MAEKNPNSDGYSTYLETIKQAGPWREPKTERFLNRMKSAQQAAPSASATGSPLRLLPLLAGQSLSLAELHERSGLDLQELLQLVKQLAEAKLVLQEANMLSITDEGRQLSSSST